MYFRKSNRLLFRRLKTNFLPSVGAAEQIIESEAETDLEEQDGKKKKHRREKVGFRDRKVCYISVYFQLYH